MSSSNKKTKPIVHALGMLGQTIPNFMYSTYYTYFYVDKLGLPIQSISMALVFFTIWDAFNDPITGYLSDRTRSKHGRRRPWIIIGAPLFLLFYVLFFSVPTNVSADTGKLVIYFTVFIMLTETMSTVTNTNYFALFPEIYPTEEERRFPNVLRQALQLVGMIVGISLTPVLTTKIGYPLTALIYGTIGMGLLVFSALFSHENPKYQKLKSPNFFDTMKSILRNRNFWAYSGSNLFYNATTALLTASIPFFVKYTLKLDDMAGTLVTAAVFVTAIPTMFLWSQLIKRVGSLKTWRIANFVLLFSMIPLYFAGNLVVSMIAGVFVGLGIAGVTATMDIVRAKIVDEDAIKSGLRREGIYQSVMSFVGRLSGLVKSLVFLLVFVVFGFESGNNPGAQPDKAALWMISIFPFILNIFAIVFAMLVKFNSQNITEIERSDL